MKKVLIAIPSYSRVTLVTSFRDLARNYSEYEDIADVRGFVTKVQKGQYSRHNPDTEFIVRPEWAESDIGSCRKFIVEWAREQGYQFVLMLDDDVRWLRTPIKGSDEKDPSKLESLLQEAGVEDFHDVKEKLFWHPEEGRYFFYRNMNARVLLDRSVLLKLIELGERHPLVGCTDIRNDYGLFEFFTSRGRVSQVMFLNIVRLKELDINFASLEERGVEDFYLNYQLLCKSVVPVYTNEVMCSLEYVGDGKGGCNVDEPTRVRLRRIIERFVETATERPDLYTVVTASVNGSFPCLRINWKNVPELVDE